MRRFFKILAGTVCLGAVLCAAFLSWTIYSLRPVCREDFFPPEKAGAQTEAKAESQLKILTWNIQMLPSPFGGWIAPLDKMQQVRAAWIVDYLKQQDYDVVCLQEAFDPKRVADLVDGLRSVYPYVVLPRRGGHFWQLSSGVLFLGRVPIKHAAHVVFNVGTGVERFAAKGSTLIEGTKDGFTFQVAGTHFPTGKDDYRLSSLKTAEERLLKPNRRDRVPQFFVGDFNIKKDTPEYGALLRETGMTDFPIDDPRPYTSDSNNSWKRGKSKLAHIDHVLLDPRGTQTTIRTQHIQRPTRESNGQAIDLADHYGVIAEALLLK